MTFYPLDHKQIKQLVNTSLSKTKTLINRQSNKQITTLQNSHINMAKLFRSMSDIKCSVDAMKPKSHFTNNT
jgi:hypothetical protein